MRKTILILAAILLTTTVALAQGATVAKEKKETVVTPAAQPYRSSPAYAELLLQRTELSSQLEALILEYTEEYPKVKELRHMLTLVDRESGRLSKVKAADVSRLTLALGKLIVRKIELETELWNLQRNYKDEHPDVQRARRKVEIYETAIAEILN